MWHPERMNHVGRLQLQPDIAPDRDLDFVCGLERAGGVRIQILELPPPLLTANLDREIRLPGESRRARGIEARDRKTADDDHGYGHRGEHDAQQATLARWMRGSRLAPRPEQRPDENDHHERPDDRTDRNDEDDQLLELRGRRPLRVEHRLRALAGGEQRQRGGSQYGQAPSQGEGPRSDRQPAGPSSKRMEAGARFSAGRKRSSSFRLGAAVIAE